MMQDHGLKIRRRHTATRHLRIAALHCGWQCRAKTSPRERTSTTTRSSESDRGGGTANPHTRDGIQSPVARVRENRDSTRDGTAHPDTHGDRPEEMVTAAREETHRNRNRRMEHLPPTSRLQHHEEDRHAAHQERGNQAERGHETRNATNGPTQEEAP